jgi:1-pyrroline-5-carboxylate dehydrogenase
MNGHLRVPPARNEPITPYAPNTPERERIRTEVRKLAEEQTEIPLWIDGAEVEHAPVDVTCPHDHGRVIGRAHSATPAHVEQAMAAARRAKADWARLDFDHRAAIFLKAADLAAGPYRDRINAATMLGQGKTVHQAEIDAVCELCDFWRFNAAFADELMTEQPQSAPGTWNTLELRPLDGFVFAVTPFNFTAIAANLPTAPALMGNTVVWKPSPTQMLSARVTVEILEAAGLPPGVINMVAGEPGPIGERILEADDLAGLHFTGSTQTFQHLWQQIGTNISRYRAYPRIVGETGGKDFIFAHPSAEIAPLLTAIVRGGYEYQGQKCSAASRVYVPKSVWTRLREPLAETIATLKMGDVSDLSNFLGAVIDRRAFDKVKSYIDYAKATPGHEIVCGGTHDDRVGYFVAPTLVRADDPKSKLMVEEIFGPVVTVFVYDDDRIEEALDLCDTSSAYALTGAVFASDRYAVRAIQERLRFTAGNFYINDKPTGAVVGQQPFGGSRASGTNDKAGSAANLMRWTSPRAVKETFVSPTDYRYPFLAPDSD